MSDVYLTRDGMQKLQDELRALKSDERPTVRSALKRARVFGGEGAPDVSRTADHAARGNSQSRAAD